jgi:hypothetical protein
VFEGSKSVPPFPSNDSSIMMNVSMAHCWNDADGGKKVLKRETCPSATLSTTNVARTDTGSNPGLGDYLLEKWHGLISM